MIDTSRATPELFAALAAAQVEIENATKNATNQHFRNNYADLAEVLNVSRPVLAAHKLCIVQSSGFDGSMVSVMTLIAHSGGGLIHSTASCVPAKSDAQGIGAATTYLRRYGLAAMAGIAQEDDDDNSAQHGSTVSKAAQQQKLTWSDEAWAKILPTIKKGLAQGKSVDDALAWLRAKADVSPAQEDELRAEVSNGGGN